MEGVRKKKKQEKQESHQPTDIPFLHDWIRISRMNPAPAHIQKQRLPPSPVIRRHTHPQLDFCSLEVRRLHRPSLHKRLNKQRVSTGYAKGSVDMGMDTCSAGGAMYPSPRARVWSHFATSTLGITSRAHGQIDLEGVAAKPMRALRLSYIREDCCPPNKC